jgi:hypothetical protein
MLMSQKRAKKLRKKLRDERAENVPLAVEKNVVKPMKSNLLMRRKDPHPNGLSPNLYRGGAILHPLSERAMYQFAKKKVDV